MKVVNLSRRPFLNRRPVIRASIALWVLGGLLLLANLWLYGQHFRGSTVERTKLDAIGRQIDAELERLDRYGDEVKSVRLGRDNARARALNKLIHKRTFPWSGLFDDLERVLPIDVYLDGVSPEIKKVETKRKTRTQRRSLTPAEARRRAQARARGEEVESQQAEAEAEPELPPVQQDRVELNLNATAKNEDAMFELVTNLYADPSFERPFLGRESSEQPGQVRFSVRVVYRTRTDALLPASEAVVAEGEVDGGVDAEGGAPVEISENDDTANVGTGAAADRRGDTIPVGAPPAEGETAAAESLTTPTRPATTRPVPSRARVGDTGRATPDTRRRISEEEMAERQAMAERTREEAVRRRAERPSGVSVLGAPQSAPPASEAAPPRSGRSRVSVAPRAPREQTIDRRSTSESAERIRQTADEEQPPASIQPSASSTPRLRRNR